MNLKRDISTIQRNLENKKNNDIIWKKEQLYKMFIEDPDIQEVLGKKDKKPYLPNMTSEEREEVDDYNKRLEHEQIVKHLKLNGIQKEVLNFIMFDIDDVDVSYTNNAIKNQNLIIMCLVHEDDMDTEYGIERTDLLDYLVRDLLCWSNSLGFQLKLINDYNDIIDKRYYARILKFKIESINQVNSGVRNRYDKFI